MDYEIRNIKRDEWPLLAGFLYEAIFVSESFGGEVPRSVIYDDPKCRAAFEGFGTLPDDRAVVVEVEGGVVGACWVRTTDEYGHIDNVTPLFSVSLYKPSTRIQSRCPLMASLLSMSRYNRCRRIERGLHEGQIVQAERERA